MPKRRGETNLATSLFLSLSLPRNHVMSHDSSWTVNGSTYGSLYNSSDFFPQDTFISLLYLAFFLTYIIHQFLLTRFDRTDVKSGYKR